MRSRSRIALAVGLAVALVLVAVGGAVTSTHFGSSSQSDADADATGEVATTLTSNLSDVAPNVTVTASSDIYQEWASTVVYDTASQAEVKSDLDAQKAGQTITDPLVAYNPFHTNTLSLYVYFETAQEASISYIVSAEEGPDGEPVSDFAREVADGEMRTTHEFQVIGLVPGVTNTVSVIATRSDGVTTTGVISVEMDELLGDEEYRLDVTDGESDAELADGLYVILGNDSDDADFMYYYDEEGVLRGEVPVIGYRSHRMLTDGDGVMYYSASTSKIAAMDELGQIVGVFDLGKYDLHHDYVWGGGSQMLVLATDTSRDDSDEDLVISLDIETGEVTELVDMGDLLPEYKEEAFAYHEANYDPADDPTADPDEDDVAGWMHINSIQYMASDDAVLLSSRETSTIFKVSGISSGEPEIEYALAAESFWEGSELEDLLLEKVGDFTIHGGQHCLVVVDDDEGLEEGQYYLQFYDNNIGESASVTNDFDYAAEGIGETEESYYYEYLVDENAGTFELADSLTVPYSGYVSSIQWVGGNLLVDCGISGSFTVYDADGEAIRTWSMGADKFIYRVFEYDL